jgi:SAM-dependent methyltransferase
LKSTILNIKINTIISIVNFFIVTPIKYINILIYLIFKKQFSQGYEYFKWIKINDFLSIKNKKLFIKNIINLDERIIEYKWIFNELAKSKKKLNLLDAGSTLNFPSIIEKLKNKFNITIQTLYPENYSFYDEGISYLYEDLTKKIFNKNTFDIITCISTLEHVGFDISMYNHSNKEILNNKNKLGYLKVIENFQFILKKGGILLITVPYGTTKQYSNLGIFDEKKIKQIIKKFKPQKSYIRYATFKEGVWKECYKNECLRNEILNDPNKKKLISQTLRSANSVSFIKLVK